MSAVHKGRSLRSWVGRTRDAASFHLTPPDWDELFIDELPFGSDANSAFLADLSRCGTYLEHGSGASTLAAVRAGRQLATVESDSRFLAFVERRCVEMDPGPPVTRTFIHADVGMTGPWGVPVFKSGVWGRRSHWREYPLAPWKILGDHFRADLVLVDGRFRVACALAVVTKQADSNWTLLVDDYAERPEYASVARFARLIEMRGRMAVFIPDPEVDLRQAESALHHSFSDWR